MLKTLEEEFGFKIKTIQTDNGREFARRAIFGIGDDVAEEPIGGGGLGGLRERKDLLRRGELPGRPAVGAPSDHCGEDVHDPGVGGNAIAAGGAGAIELDEDEIAVGQGVIGGRGVGGGRPVEQVLVSAGRLLLRRIRPEHGCVSGHVVGIEGQNGDGHLSHYMSL